MELTVATFNIRNITDRYAERKPLLLAAFAEMSPQLAGLQEVIFSGERQDDLLAAQAPEHVYKSFDARSDRYPSFGNAILVAVGDVVAREELRLSHGRVVQRVLITLPGQRTLWFANTHLHHVPGEPEVREEQARALCEWLAEAPAASATIVTGDFNAPRSEPAYDLMRDRGYRSAYFEANGEEPAVTWPSGIQAPTMDTDGDPNCLDYVWMKGAVRAIEARVRADVPAPGDPTLYPSDHFAILARLEIS
jgi:endonuclease/exonuclease/phosphatase family metal-dependent hydrolase